MAILKPFAAIRPVKELACQVAALPYDVMNTEEAREMVKGNPYSFLHVDRAEIDFDTPIDPYDHAVYAKAASTLKQMRIDGTYMQDESNCLYIYREIMYGRAQTGLVGCVSIDDYANEIIKKHELTRADKEADRIRHVDTCNANTGPIFLTYRAKQTISDTMNQWMETYAPIYDFTSDDGVCHTVWKIDDPEIIEGFQKAFENIPYLYIADGHHRAASAFHVGMKRRAEHPNYTGDEEFNYFLAVLFPDEQLHVWPYNRYVHDLNGLTNEAFLEKLKDNFEVMPVDERYEPDKRHMAGMYLDGHWYALAFKQGSFDDNDPIEHLDVSILQNNLLTPILGIGNPRTDKRIDFVGGIRGLQELERLVNEGQGVSFALYPTTVEDLMEIADKGKIMPPKSTWFEPKLRSGIFIHELS